MRVRSKKGKKIFFFLLPEVVCINYLFIHFVLLYLRAGICEAAVLVVVLNLAVSGCELNGRRT